MDHPPPTEPARPAAPPPPWTVAQFAQVTSVPATTLRFWDKHELLSPDRLDNGHRRYTPAHLARVEMITMCQLLGCTIAEVRLILDPPNPAARVSYAEQRLPEVRARIDSLQSAVAVLEHMATCTHLDLVSCSAWIEDLLRSRAASAPE